MAKDFTFTLDLETALFTASAGKAGQAVQQMSADAVEAIQQITTSTDHMTERFRTANKGISDLGRSSSALGAGGLDRQLGGASDALDRLGGGAAKAASGLDRAAKAGQALEALKGVVEPLGEVINDLGPKTKSAVDGITATFTAAATGFALGGPIGAAAVGGIAAIKGLWDWVQASGEEQVRTAELAGQAQDMLNRKIAEHVQLLKNVQLAAAEAAQEIIRGSAWEVDAPRRNAEDRSTAQRQRDLQLDRDRIAAAELPEGERIEAERAFDKRAVRNRMDDGESAMAADLAGQRAKEARIDEKRGIYATALENSPKSADVQRAALTEKITRLDKELGVLADSIQKTAWKLDQNREKRALLLPEEDKTIDARRNREAKGAADRAEIETFKVHDQARKSKIAREDAAAQTQPAVQPETQAAAPGSAGPRPATPPRRPGTVRGVRFRHGFQYRGGKKVMGAAGGDEDDDDADADDNGPATPPRRPGTVRGVRFKTGFQYRGGKKVMGAAGGGDDDNKIKRPDVVSNMAQKGVISMRGAKLEAKDPASEEMLELLRAIKDALVRHPSRSS